MESFQIIDKFCSSPFANFLNMAYIFTQVIRNAKQSTADILQNRCFLKVSQISLESNYVGVSFSKVADLKAWNFIKKTPTQVFSSEICGIFKIAFFYRTPSVAASGNGKAFHRLSIFYYHDLAKSSVFI